MDRVRHKSVKPELSNEAISTRTKKGKDLMKTKNASLKLKPNDSRDSLCSPQNGKTKRPHKDRRGGSAKKSREVNEEVPANTQATCDASQKSTTPSPRTPAGAAGGAATATAAAGNGAAASVPPTAAVTKVGVEEATDAPADVAGTEDNRAKWTARILKDYPRMKKLSTEFQDFRKWRPPNANAAVMAQHDDKNRYNDIICLDATRVVLKDRPADNDYIHANWMTMPDGFQYISTQGPMDTTLEDFWHMIYTEKAAVVLMLCAFSEDKYTKCAQYYPLQDNVTLQFGVYKVSKRIKKSSSVEGVKYRRIEVEKTEGAGAPHVVHHYTYLNWPDHIAPKTPTPAVQLYKLVREKACGTPVVVHCSAGIGRTATFVGIDFCNQRIKTDATVQPLQLVKEMRHMRCHSVQSYFQYTFMIVCVLELFMQDNGIQENAIPRNEALRKFVAEYTSAVTRRSTKLSSTPAGAAAQ